MSTYPGQLRPRLPVLLRRAGSINADERNSFPFPCRQAWLQRLKAALDERKPRLAVRRPAVTNGPMAFSACLCSDKTRMDSDLFRTQRDVGSAVIAELSAAGFAGPDEIGRGGFGIVFRCHQTALDRIVAVKVLTTELDEDRKRFLREQRAMGRLTGHPNIANETPVENRQPIFDANKLNARQDRRGLAPMRYQHA
jgi:Protein kinase domain